MWFISPLVTGYICYVMYIKFIICPYLFLEYSKYTYDLIKKNTHDMIEIDHKTDPGVQRSLPQSNTNLYIWGKPMRRVKLDYRVYLKTRS